MRDAKEDLAVCEATTKGPWRRFYEGSGDHVVLAGEEEEVATCHGPWAISPSDRYEQVADNAEFIAMSREALPYWINEAKRKDKIIEKTRKELQLIVNEATKMAQQYSGSNMGLCVAVSALRAYACRALYEINTTKKEEATP